MITRYTGGRDKAAQNAAKQRYNTKTYDQVKIFVRKGGRDVMHALAESAGMSLAEYIRHLIIKDAQERGFDACEALGGGGKLLIAQIRGLEGQLTITAEVSR